MYNFSHDSTHITNKVHVHCMLFHKSTMLTFSSPEILVPLYVFIYINIQSIFVNNVRIA